MGMNKNGVMNMKISILVGITLSLLLALPVAASDYMLGVFGNANEDETINMQDVTYTELIILEYRDETELADAKYDGKINMQDVTQIELVILGKEKELTLIDDTVTDVYPNGKPVTITKPINRIVGLNTNVPEALRTVELEGTMVGISKATADKKKFFPEISKLPIVADDVEAIISLSPDIVIGYGGDMTRATIDLEDKLKDTGIVLVRLDFNRPETTIKDIQRLGYILDKEVEAEEFIAFYEGCLDPIKETVEALSEDEKPGVYLEMWKPYQVTAQGTGPHKVCTMGGGTNIAADLEGYPIADPEWVIEQNPDFIVRITRDDGYELDDPSKMEAILDEIVNRPELANVNAVKNGRVYVIDRQATFIRHFVGVTCMTKWFHPELFEDLDPEAINREYIERFQGMPYQGIYAYPPPEGS